MTTVTLRMPRLGETMEEGTVADWLVDVGESFTRGTPLVEFETDKTAVEFPALGPGKLVRQLVASGDTVKLGEPVAEIELDGDHDWVGETNAQAGDGSGAAADAKADVAQGSSGSPMVAAGGAATGGDADSNRVAPDLQATTPPALVDGPVRATPPARLAAHRAHVSLERIPGSGRRGRIELSDVEGFLAEHSNAKLAATTWGSNEGARVLLVHGFAGDMTTFDQLGSNLGRSGFATKAIDLPAHGETAAEAASFDSLVDGLVSELRTADAVHVVAHSLGAAVAVAASVRSHVASLTLISPAGLGYEIAGNFVSGMASPASVGETGHLLRQLSRRADRFSDAAISGIHATLRRGRLVRLASDIARGDRQLVNVVRPLADLAERIPVHIIVGHRDAIVPWQDALMVSPRINVHHFPDAGHMPHWDFPAEVTELLEDVISHDRA